jgi:hypothetical protein
LLIALRNFGLLFIALVQVEAVSESDALAGGNHQVAGGFVGKLLEIVLPEGIGSE